MDILAEAKPYMSPYSMMELIKQRFVKINIIFFILVLFNSCQERVQDGKLECILDSIKVDVNGMNIEIGQYNGWTDTTVLILVTYHRKSMNIPISGNLKGVYKGNDIYFYQENVDTLDAHEYKKIPNNINWNTFVQKILDSNIIQPPYDPIGVQIEYNIKRDCVSNIVKGKGYRMNNIISKCDCENLIAKE